MNIVVCIKQVPDTTEVKIDPETNTLVRSGVASIINPFDEFALEEAVKIKEETGSGKVTVICMGPPQAEEALRECIARGADEAILLSDRRFAGSDTWSTSKIIAEGIRKIGDYNLIITGKQAIDGDTAQVGPGISVNLGIPQLAFVSEIMEISPEKSTMKRMTETGHEVYEMNLPAVISVVKEINEPRLPSLRGKMKAKKAEITVWDCDVLGMDEGDIGLDGSPTRVVEIFSPPKPEGGEIIEEEDVNTAIDKLMASLTEKEIL